MTECDVRFYPHPPPFSEGGALCRPAAAVRQPGYLLQASSRRPIGFASPPRSGFAFIAAPQRQRLCTIVLSWKRPAYRPHGHFSQPSVPRLYARWLFLGTNIRERRQGEVRLAPDPASDD